MINKKFCLYICAFILPVLFSSCLLRIEDLEEDIRIKFENADSDHPDDSQGGSSDDSKPDNPSSDWGKFDSSCKASVSDCFLFANSIALKLQFSGNSNYYKYCFYNEKESWNQLMSVFKELKMTKAQTNDNNTVEYEFTTCPSYFYLLPLKNEKTYGSLITYPIPADELKNRPTNVPSITIKRSGGEISYTIESNYDYYAILLTGNIAEFADKLSDAAFWLKYKGSARSYSGKTSFKLTSDPGHILVAACCYDKRNNEIVWSKRLGRKFL